MCTLPGLKALLQAWQYVTVQRITNGSIRNVTAIHYPSSTIQQDFRVHNVTFRWRPILSIGIFCLIKAQIQNQLIRDDNFKMWKGIGVLKRFFKNDNIKSRYPHFSLDQFFTDSDVFLLSEPDLFESKWMKGVKRGLCSRQAVRQRTGHSKMRIIFFFSLSCIKIIRWLQKRYVFSSKCLQSV